MNFEDTAQLLKRNPGLLNFLAADHQLLNRVAGDIRRLLRQAWEVKKLPGSRMVSICRSMAVPACRARSRCGVPGLSLFFPAAPQSDSFHRAIFDLVGTGGLNKLSKCSLKECPTPYFIRRGPKKQPYCSTACHGHALREIKRRWWRRNRSKTRLSKGVPPARRRSKNGSGSLSRSVNSDCGAYGSRPRFGSAPR